MSWFANWFDSPYYHTLYKNRDEKEAQVFIDNLVQHLQAPKGSTLIDIACGKGRHATYFNSLGLDVVGVDLSPNSIASATKNENATLQFAVHDMREVYQKNNFDVVTNLFTSFGYFEKKETDSAILQKQFEALKKGGVFIQDYINAQPIKPSLPLQTLTEKPKNTYFIKKYLENGFIKKQITFKKDGVDQVYTEQVKIYSLETLKSLHEEAGLQVQKVWGDYTLAPFEANTSKRIIIISKKC